VSTCGFVFSPCPAPDSVRYVCPGLVVVPVFPRYSEV
jgi:hypothetical protein